MKTSNLGQTGAATISNLVENTVYTVAVIGSNIGGSSDESEHVTAITLFSKVLSVGQSDITQTTITLVWTVNDDATYKIHYKKDGWVYFTCSPDLGNVGTTIITGLEANTQYQIYVTAQNVGGSSVHSDTIYETTLINVPS